MDTNPPSLSASSSPSLSSLSKTVERINSSDNPIEYIEKAKIDLIKLYQELNDLALNAMVWVKSGDGDQKNIGPDNKARIAAIALLLELAKHIKDKGTVAQVAIINDPGIIEDAKRIVAMRNSG